MKFEHTKTVATEVKELLADWEAKKAPLLEAKRKLLEAENEVQNSYDMDTVKRKNQVIKEVGYTLTDIDEALKRWHRARFEAIREYNISGKLSSAVKTDETINKGRKQEFEQLKALQEEFIAKVRPIVKEMAENRVQGLTEGVRNFDYVMQVRQELTPTDTVNVKFSPYESYYTGTLVKNMMNTINEQVFQGLNEQPINSRY
ncbi:hypothetical protein P4J23_10950 [Bacillus cereus]|nr:hypothetical protein [Bacillus cereus]